MFLKYRLKYLLIYLIDSKIINLNCTIENLTSNISKLSSNNDKELNINQNDIIYIKNSNNDEKSLESGESLLFPYIITEPKLLFDNFSNDIIHINYGEISLKVEKVNNLFLKCVALNSGTIHKQNLLSVYIIL